jgi:hypothetical protein
VQVAAYGEVNPNGELLIGFIQAGKLLPPEISSLRVRINRSVSALPRGLLYLVKTGSISRIAVNLRKDPE